MSCCHKSGSSSHASTFGSKVSYSLQTASYAWIGYVWNSVFSRFLLGRRISRSRWFKISEKIWMVKSKVNCWVLAWKLIDLSNDGRLVVHQKLLKSDGVIILRSIQMFLWLWKTEKTNWKHSKNKLEFLLALVYVLNFPSLTLNVWQLWMMK